MKAILLLAVVATCSGAYQDFNSQYNTNTEYPIRTKDGGAAILRLAAESTDHGYQFNYETDNGIQASEAGQEADGIQAQGQYSYTGDDGQVYSVTYTAGRNGFQAQGAHIPTPPPIPEEIARALEQITAEERSGIYDDGSYDPSKYSDNGVTSPPEQHYEAIAQLRSLQERQQAAHAQQHNIYEQQQANSYTAQQQRSSYTKSQQSIQHNQGGAFNRRAFNY